MEPNSFELLTGHMNLVLDRMDLTLHIGIAVTIINVLLLGINFFLNFFGSLKLAEHTFEAIERRSANKAVEEREDAKAN